MEHRKPSPALLVAILALIVALSGVAYAAVKLPKGSVGTKQLKNNAVVSSKVKNGSLQAADFKTPPAGPTGPAGATGPAGTQAFGGAIPSGTVLRGTFAGILQHNDSAAAQIRESFYFGGEMSATPVLHWIPSGGIAPPECPGNATTPTAQRGHICFYAEASSNVVAPTALVAKPFGMSLQWSSPADGQALVSGTWAVTAP